MPEGPEIKISTEFLSYELVPNTDWLQAGANLKSHSIITTARLHPEGRYRKTPPSGWQGFLDMLPVFILGIECIGKLVYWKLSSVKDNKTIYMLNTYGMTGQWLTTNIKHPCLSFKIKDTTYTFDDARHFGTVKFVDINEWHKKIKSLCPDIFSCTEDQFVSLYKKKGNKTLAEVMMNQSVVSGIGNYVKAEALYKAKLSPHKKVKDLSDAELQLLCSATKKVVETAYQEGGATIRTYKNPDGSEGYATKNFAVYRKDKDSLGNKIISEETLDKRTTWWVPTIQK